MSSRAFSEWQLFEAIEPAGEARADWRAALVCYTVAVAMGGYKGKVSDFLLDFDEPEPPDEMELAERIKANLLGLSSRQGAKRGDTGQPERVPDRPDR